MAEDTTFKDALEADAREKRPRNTLLDSLLSDLVYDEIMLVSDRFKQSVPAHMRHPGFRDLALALVRNMEARATESNNQVHLLQGEVVKRRMEAGRLNDEIARRTQKR